MFLQCLRKQRSSIINELRSRVTASESFYQTYVVTNAEQELLGSSSDRWLSLVTSARHTAMHFPEGSIPLSWLTRLERSFARLVNALSCIALGQLVTCSFYTACSLAGPLAGDHAHQLSVGCYHAAGSNVQRPTSNTY
jgi:hypothetical protein